MNKVAFTELVKENVKLKREVQNLNKKARDNRLLASKLQVAEEEIFILKAKVLLQTEELRGYINAT